LEKYREVTGRDVKAIIAVTGYSLDLDKTALKALRQLGFTWDFKYWAYVKPVSTLEEFIDTLRKLAEKILNIAHPLWWDITLREELIDMLKAFG